MFKLAQFSISMIPMNEPNLAKKSKGFCIYVNLIWNGPLMIMTAIKTVTIFKKNYKTFPML